MAGKEKGKAAVETPVVPATAAEAAAAAPKEKKEPQRRLDIVRGRMPVSVVYMVKFGDNRGESTATLAKLFGTTTGKIDDIKKERGFKYVTADFAPTAQQKADGIEYLKKHPGYANGDVDKLINELEAYEEATDDQAKAFDAARAASHGQPFRKKTGEVADGGGGNRRGKEKATAEELVA
jgi:hypothetical protein